MPLAKKKLLLYCAGIDEQEIFETLTLIKLTRANKIYKTSNAALERCFHLRSNNRYERHIFRSFSQKSDESIDQYVIHLHMLSESCEFHYNRNEFVDQAIKNCSSSKLQK